MSVGIADAARFRTTPVVSDGADQVVCRHESGDVATALVVVASNVRVRVAVIFHGGPDRELAGIGCAESPRHKRMEFRVWRNRKNQTNASSTKHTIMDE